jgi:hypothetical protein
VAGVIGRRSGKFQSGQGADFKKAKLEYAMQSHATQLVRLNARLSANYPFGPGYNFPYPDRPYGDPDHS